jgi:hypothetical protein
VPCWSPHPGSDGQEEGEVKQVTLCNHLWSAVDVSPSSVGCDECIRAGMRWVNLRICMTCGHVGCCNDSLGKHASVHWLVNPGHPIIRSFEPGEHWWWCFSDRLLFEVKGAPLAPSHKNTGPSMGRLQPGWVDCPEVVPNGRTVGIVQHGTLRSSAIRRLVRRSNGWFASSVAHSRSVDGWGGAAFTPPGRPVGGRT